MGCDVEGMFFEALSRKRERKNFNKWLSRGMKMAEIIIIIIKDYFHKSILF